MVWFPLLALSSPAVVVLGSRRRMRSMETIFINSDETLLLPSSRWRLTVPTSTHLPMTLSSVCLLLILGFRCTHKPIEIKIRRHQCGEQASEFSFWSCYVWNTHGIFDGLFSSCCSALPLYTTIFFFLSPLLLNFWFESHLGLFSKTSCSSYI